MADAVPFSLPAKRNIFFASAANECKDMLTPPLFYMFILRKMSRPEA